MSVFLRESLKLNWAVISLRGHEVILYSFQMKASDKGSGVISALTWKESHPRWISFIFLTEPKTFIFYHEEKGYN